MKPRSSRRCSARRIVRRSILSISARPRLEGQAAPRASLKCSASATATANSASVGRGSAAATARSHANLVAMDMGGNPLGKPLASRAVNCYFPFRHNNFQQFQPRLGNRARFSFCGDVEQPGQGQNCQRRPHHQQGGLYVADHGAAPTKRRKLSPVMTLIPPIFRISSFPLAARRRMVERLQGPRRTAWLIVKASACGFGSGRFGESLGIFSTFRESRGAFLRRGAGSHRAKSCQGENIFIRLFLSFSGLVGRQPSGGLSAFPASRQRGEGFGLQSRGGFLEL